MKQLKRLVTWLLIGITVAAVVQQLRRPKEERTWRGTVLGVPYDFRFPTPQRVRDAWWNADERRLFLPRAFGVGWSVNLHRVKEVLLGPGGENGDG